MMTCSYLSTGMTSKVSGAACWTPPSMGCMVPEMEGPSIMQPPMYLRPPTGALCLQPAPMTLCPEPSQEPALDLSTSSSLKPHLPSPASDDEAEWQVLCHRQLLDLRLRQNYYWMNHLYLSVTILLCHWTVKLYFSTYYIFNFGCENGNLCNLLYVNFHYWYLRVEKRCVKHRRVVSIVKW